MTARHQEWGTGRDGDLAAWYRGFAHAAQEEGSGYAPIARAVAADDELLSRLASLPRRQRQPNLVLAAVRHLGGPTDSPATFRDWVLHNWERLTEVTARRRTQTNEAARCATLLPALASLPQPLALIEVGAAAGLCLYPDRLRYRYGDRPPIGPESPVTLRCAVTGPAPLPRQPPEVAWRAGIDLNPLDVTDPEDVDWLECLIWPGPTHDPRRDRLRAMVDIARREPPRIVAGDMMSALPDLVREIPKGATPVVFHSAVLAYLTPEERTEFRHLVHGLGVHWVCNEGPMVASQFDWPVPTTSSADAFVLTLDEHPLARTGSHGQFVSWL
ncbi:DUF2332 domain-containing protein [Spiractinospora alimapuensis]|uniref:DUF2332 domain-containing protein n=1 Tax=Spiractinospora alimapuensis TaxID=2820884 RepID=UPI001F3EE2DF|nr:DUF2332 domain-containing protein [Spiractinospora alimapuensis]QVQ52603.1 DUF2332 domain-containing protein [Spiractinospora alimapuensis]